MFATAKSEQMACEINGRDSELLFQTQQGECLESVCATLGVSVCLCTSLLCKRYGTSMHRLVDHCYLPSLSDILALKQWVPAS